MNPRAWTQAPGWRVALGCLLIASSFSTRAADLAGVELEEIGGDRKMTLAELNGSIVVVDFFAAWCAPCVPVSRSIERDIRRRFEGRTEGVPVHVLAVSEDEEITGRTRSFMRRAELKDAFHDPGAKLFERLGGRALPFVLVLDGTQAEGGSGWTVRYQKTGFGGTAEIVAAIGSIDQAGARPDPAKTITTNMPSPTTVARSEVPDPGTTTTTQTAGLGFEGLFTDDFTIFENNLNYRAQATGSDFGLSVTHRRYSVFYEPPIVNLLTPSAELSDDYYAFQASWQKSLRPRWSGSISGGGYTGFSDFRSMWLQEYYRQFFEPVPGYRDRDPAGFNFSAGLRWEYLPLLGFAQLELVHQKDHISPAYEIAPGQPLTRGLDELSTLAGKLSLENVLSPRLRSLQQFLLSDTTERDLRFAYQGSLNWAAAENWVLRTTGGVTTEPPNFDAFFAGQTLEYDHLGRWYARVFYRLYHDNGLIRDPLVPSSAQPTLDSLRVGAGIRYQTASWTIDLSYSPYFTRYGILPAPSAAFRNLYRDRHWHVAQVALQYRFP